MNIRIEMGEKVFGINEVIGKETYMLDTYMPTLHHLLLPTNIQPMTSLYLASIHDSLRGIISSMDGASGALKAFIIPPAYRAAAHAGFGTDFPVEKSYPLFKTFDDSFHLLGAGLPRTFLSKPIKAWEQLVDLFEDYLAKQTETGSEPTPFVEVALDGSRRGKWVCPMFVLDLFISNVSLPTSRLLEMLRPYSLPSFGLFRPMPLWLRTGLLPYSFKNPTAFHLSYKS